MYHIKVIPVVYSKLFPFRVSIILLCCISYSSYCTKWRGSGQGLWICS